MKKLLKIKKFSAIDLVFIGLDHICNQNGARDFKKIQFRIACYTIRILAMFVVPAYSAIIISFLAISVLKIPFRNLEEFKMDGRYKLLVPIGSYMDYYFKVIIIISFKRSKSIVISDKIFFNFRIEMILIFAISTKI